MNTNQVVTNLTVPLGSQVNPQFAVYTFNQAGRFRVRNITAIPNSVPCAEAIGAYEWYINVMSTTPTFTATPANCDKIYSFNFTFPQFASPCTTNLTTPSVTWNFGDGVIATYNGGNFNTAITGVANTTGTFLNPTHTYTGAYGTAYTVTATVNNGRCGNRTANQTFTIRQPIAVSINSLNEGCAGSQLALSTSNNAVQTPVGYAWSGPNGYSSFVATPLITLPSPPSSYTYNVTVTDGRNCTGVASKQISSIGCCNSPAALSYNAVTADGLLFNLLDNNVILLQDYLSGTIQNINTQFIFNGLLTLDRNLTFINCPNITFGQNGGIVTSQYQFVLNNTKLSSCGNFLWKGVEVNNSTGGIVMQNNANIYDAECAILCSNAGSVNCTNSWFYDNFVAIRLTQFTPNFIVHSCRFITNGTGIKPSAINNTGLTNGNIAIDFSNVQGTSGPVTLGYLPPVFNDKGIYTNDFKRFNCHIRVTNSRVKIINNIFRYPSADPTGSFDYWGKSISSTAPASLSGLPFTNFELIVGDNAGPDVNVFESPRVNSIVHNGISNVKILKNYNQGSPTGSVFTVLNAISKTVEISGNRIQTYGPSVIPYGILTLNCNGSVLTIRDNDLIMSDQNYTQPNTPIYGILNVTYSNLGTSNFPLIQNNSIRHTNFGIYSTGTTGSQILDNSIGVRTSFYTSPTSGSSWRGIYSEFDNNTQIDRNFIRREAYSSLPTYPGGSTVADKAIGILINSQPGFTHLVCDSVIGLHYGFAANGTNTSGAWLRNNSFSNCRTGVAVLNNGTIGDQGYPNFFGSQLTFDNKWYTGNTFRFGAYNTNASSQNWYLRSNNNITLPSIYNPVSNCTGINSNLYHDQTGIGTPFSLQCLVSSVAINYCGELSNRRSGDEPDFAENIGWYEKVAQDSVTYTEYEGDNKNWSAAQLYNFLDKHNELLAQSTVLDSFYQANETAAFAQFAKLSEKVVNTTDTIIAKVLSAENNSLVPQTKHEENLQLLNRLHLQYFVKGNYQLSSVDSLTLLNMAKQCYITDGPAVFRARSMYATVTGKPDNSFAEKCLAETGNFKKEQENEKQILIKVYPTLLEKGAQINIESPESGEFKLVNSIGQLLQHFSFDKGKNIVKTDVLSSGYYVYFIKLSNGETDNGKLIIK